MALLAGEHERLLSLYRTRVDSYIGVDADHGWLWRHWCRTLLSFGGSLVVPPGTPEPHLTELLASATAFDLPVKGVPGDIGECHRNVASLWIDATITAIVTGYALSSDDLWRQHSWGIDTASTLIETTDIRLIYVGISLPAGPASMQFAGSNTQSHLKTLLAQRGPRAAELISMIRELAGVANGSRPGPASPRLPT